MWFANRRKKWRYEMDMLPVPVTQSIEYVCHPTSVMGRPAEFYRFMPAYPAILQESPKRQTVEEILDEEPIDYSTHPKQKVIHSRVNDVLNIPIDFPTESASSINYSQSVMPVTQSIYWQPWVNKVDVLNIACTLAEL